MLKAVANQAGVAEYSNRMKELVEARKAKVDLEVYIQRKWPLNSRQHSHWVVENRADTNADPVCSLVHWAIGDGLD